MEGDAVELDHGFDAGGLSPPCGQNGALGDRVELVEKTQPREVLREAVADVLPRGGVVGVTEPLMHVGALVVGVDHRHSGVGKNGEAPEDGGRGVRDIGHVDEVGPDPHGRYVDRPDCPHVFEAGSVKPVGQLVSVVDRSGGVDVVVGHLFFGVDPRPLQPERVVDRLPAVQDEPLFDDESLHELVRPVGHGAVGIALMGRHDGLGGVIGHPGSQPRHPVGGKTRQPDL